MGKLVDERGQMAVEFAFVAPVLIVMGLVVFSLTQYLYLSNKFDHVCRQVIVVDGIAPQGDESQNEINERIRSLIADQFKNDNVSVVVTSDFIDSSGVAHLPSDSRIIPFLKKYTCTMEYRPIFSDIQLSFVRSRGPFVLKSTCEVVVDPYRGGILV